MQAISAFQIALQHNPQNTEVSRKIKRLTQLAREQKRAVDVENLRSNIDIGKNLQSLKKELVSFFYCSHCCPHKSAETGTKKFYQQAIP